MNLCLGHLKLRNSVLWLLNITKMCNTQRERTIETTKRGTHNNMQRGGRIHRTFLYSR